MGEYLHLHILKKDKYEQYVRDMDYYANKHQSEPDVENYEILDLYLGKYTGRYYYDLTTKGNHSWGNSSYIKVGYDTKDVIVELLNNLSEQASYHLEDNLDLEYGVDNLKNIVNAINVSRDDDDNIVVRHEGISKLIELGNSMEKINTYLESEASYVFHLEKILVMMQVLSI